MWHSSCILCAPTTREYKVQTFSQGPNKKAQRAKNSPTSFARIRNLRQQMSIIEAPAVCPRDPDSCQPDALFSSVAIFDCRRVGRPYLHQPEPTILQGPCALFMRLQIYIHMYIYTLQSFIPLEPPKKWGLVSKGSQCTGASLLADHA